MTLDLVVLIGIWVIFPILLICFVPKYRVREMVAVFMFFQTLTWVFSIGLTYFDLLSAPIREFLNSTKVNFTLKVEA